MQAGDRLKALKCLLKSGDTKSIVYYAGVSRSRDIYILAANYLQNLDWHDDPQVWAFSRTVSPTLSAGVALHLSY